MWKSVCMILNLKCELKHMYVSTKDEAVDWALSVFQFCIYKVTCKYNDGRLTHLKYLLSNIVSMLNNIIKIYRLNEYENVVNILKQFSHKLLSQIDIC